MNRYVLAIVAPYNKYSLLSGLLILIIGMSLSLSTVHNHDILNYSYDSQQSVKHTISKDTTTCPICGYIYHTDYEATVSADITIRVQFVVAHTHDLDRDQSPAESNQKRGPPHFA